MKIKSKILNLACSVAVGSLFANAISAQERVLNVTNWGEYIAEDTISNFENEYGIKVVYDAYDSAEAIDAKLLAGSSGYDVVSHSGGMTARLIQAGKNKKDQSIEKSLPEAKWRDIARNQIAPMMGADPDVCSAHDVFHFTNTEGDWLVENGLGAFIKYLYKDIEVITNCAAKKIDYSSNGVKVETPDGVITATYAVLTVSTGVLSQNKIKFFPKLPPRKKDAINNLPNGLLNKIGFEFNIKWREAHQGQSADYLVGENDFCSIDFGFYDSNIAVGFVAGRFAEQLEMDGPGAATSFCSEALKSIFGNDITKFINKTTETAWKSNINSYGSYSYALPGGFGAREILAETLDDRLFFAGEATMSNSQATVHGAYLSGIDVAAKILAVDNSN
ncbi:FAD-dependent oxidoreductase [bacterium]|nr:FAD-dependent oxidoreductase [bacterium]